MARRVAPTRVAVRWRSSCRGGAVCGTSMIETLVTLALIGIVVQQAAPTLVTWRERQRVEAAGRHLALEIGRACSFAVASGRTHAVAFEPGDDDLRWALAADGDGDGISAADLDSGTDALVDGFKSLRARFPGVEPGRPPGAPPVAGGALDRLGLAFGRTSAVSCSASGGARSGTLYLRSSRGEGVALRVYGPTARLTLWWWDRAGRQWVAVR